MPKHRYQRREPTDDWQQLRPLLKDSGQITYEIIRPVVLWGVTPKERAVETGMSQRTIYSKRTSLTKQAWRVCYPRNHHRQFPSSINARCLHLCAKPSSMHMQNIPP